MKIAVLIPGQARFFRNNNSIINLANLYSADIYIHTWKKENNLFEAAPYNNINPFTISENDISEYVKIYNPQKFLIETELTTDFIDQKLKRKEYEKTSHRQTKYNFYSYLYSLNKCLSLIENFSFYDFYIITRADMTNIQIPDLNIADRNKLITLPIHDQTLIRGYSHLSVDMNLCIIPSQFIALYGNLINKLDEYYDKGYHYNWEEMFYAHLFESGLINHLIQIPPPQIFFQLKRNEEGSSLHTSF